MNKAQILGVYAGMLSLSATACTPSVSDTLSTRQFGFDGIATTVGSAIMPTGYGGLSWENFNVADGAYSPFYNTGFRTGAVSPPNTAFNGNSNPATILSPASIDVVEAYFTSAYAQTDGPYQLQIDAYLGNALKYTRRISVVTAGPTLASLNFQGVDRLVFTSLVNPADQRRSQFVMDNLTVTASRVP